MSKYEEHEDYAETAVLLRAVPLADDSADGDDTGARIAADVHGRYAEYLRSLDELPVLRDVVQEPRSTALPDFRAGERRDVRGEPRPDAYVLRQEQRAEIERHYDEYVAAMTEASAGEKRGPKRVAKGKGRAKRAARTRRRKA